ncbi:2TM domain-containing protein [Streptomyces sp. GbtcB6]|uniref:2TM domain-containing protein n=1 Tax=Streptomyces sp. GbtcB6 TaxID=2824751 RepID=UPI0020C69F0B|nr:2TM domain-containing protein [Streptomyces sp. GbtcB6]
MRWGLRVHLFWYIIAHVAQVALWAIFTPDHFFWPLWSILSWGIGLVIHFWAVRSKSRSLVRP